MSEDQTPPPASVMYRLGGRTYPAEVNRRCPICCSPYRSMVESRVICGDSYASIARSLPSGANLNQVQISRHVRGCGLPMAEDVRRQIVEDRGIERGVDPETHQHNIADHISMLRLGVNDVMERMVARDIEPTIAEGIAMARILTKVEAHAEDREDASRLHVAALRSILSLVRETLTDEQYQAFSGKVMNDPNVQALMTPTPSDTITVGAHQ